MQNLTHHDKFVSAGLRAHLLQQVFQQVLLEEIIPSIGGRCFSCRLYACTVACPQIFGKCNLEIPEVRVPNVWKPLFMHGGPSNESLCPGYHTIESFYGFSIAEIWACFDSWWPLIRSSKL